MGSGFFLTVLGGPAVVPIERLTRPWSTCSGSLQFPTWPGSRRRRCRSTQITTKGMRFSGTSELLILSTQYQIPSTSCYTLNREELACCARNSNRSPAHRSHGVDRQPAHLLALRTKLATAKLLLQVFFPFLFLPLMSPLHDHPTSLPAASSTYLTRPIATFW
jgi:hypothetical protein